MQFNKVIGQTQLKKAFIQQINADRMPHAQLFLGASGSGSLAVARAFAQYVLCTNRQANDACGQCRACSKAGKLVHPDLHFSFPTVGSKVTSDTFLPQWRETLLSNPYMNYNQWLNAIGAENKQGNINKDECVNIIKKMSLKAFESRYKILIIWLPELLGKEGNRLLKLIEEPPENTLFILVAENQELILNTILSRCQLTKIHPLNDDEIVNGLMQQAQVSSDMAQKVAHLSNGDFGEALSLSQHQESENAELFLDWMRKCYIGKPNELVAWVEAFAKLGRERQKYFLRYALHFMREYMLLKLTGNANVRLLDKELATAQNLTKVIEFDQIETITSLLNDVTYYVERNANAKVLFLDTSIRLNKILKKKVIV